MYNLAIPILYNVTSKHGGRAQGLMHWCSKQDIANYEPQKRLALPYCRAGGAARMHSGTIRRIHRMLPWEFRYHQ